MKRMAAIVVALALLTPASASFAAGKGKKPPAPPGPILRITPDAGKAHSVFTLKGRLFPANEKMPVQMFCPQWGNKSHGYDHWTVKSDSKGNFAQKHRALKPVNARSASCQVYVFVNSHGRAFYVASQFAIKA